jgi:RimJ/RimL family protein N-acetyltransferase
MTVPPTLHTKRLLLRAQRPDDTEALMAAFADDAYSRFITREQRGLSRLEAWRPIALVPGMWAANGYGQWMVEERATGLPVGRLGPWAPEGWPDFEIGWSIFPAHQGKGYATEAALAARDWAYGVLELAPLVSLIDVENAASIRVAQKLGASIEAPHPTDDGHRIMRWRHPGSAV